MPFIRVKINLSMPSEHCWNREVSDCEKVVVGMIFTEKYNRGYLPPDKK